MRTKACMEATSRQNLQSFANLNFTWFIVSTPKRCERVTDPQANFVTFALECAVTVRVQSLYVFTSILAANSHSYLGISTPPVKRSDNNTVTMIYSQQTTTFPAILFVGNLVYVQLAPPLSGMLRLNRFLESQCVTKLTS
jgi:hypothetical protein